MAELLGILIAALLVNNFVLAQFLGLCPFMGVTARSDTALATSFATTFVLTLSALVSHLLYHQVLLPLDLAYLDIVVFIVTIAAVVQFTELFLRGISPLLHQILGIYLPLITTNCAVLGVALLAVRDELSLAQTLFFSIGAALGFVLVMVIFAALREHLQENKVPNAFRGTPITLITAGLLSLAFMGFSGLST
ncbi:MAG: electron transport complex subunit RsxA [Pseudomonadales bacterium]